jgi:hypothetical protein
MAMIIRRPWLINLYNFTDFTRFDPLPFARNFDGDWKSVKIVKRG